MRKTTKKKLAHKQKEIKKSKSAFEETNARNEHIEPVNDVCNEDNPQAFENIAIQTKLNSKNNDAPVEENPQAFENNATRTEGNSEVAMENERLVQDVDANSIIKRIIRGQYKVRKLSSYPVSRIEVEFNAEGAPVGSGSVKLSSYLGPLVREYVPVTLNNWRHLSNELKDVLWDSIQARFKLDEKWQRKPIFQQMGCIWRNSKCILVRQIVKAKTKEERLKLKPNNIKSMKEWNKFIKLKTSSNFKTLSEKFKTMRSNQLPHTCGRKGMARLAEELREKSVDPSSVSRAQVWIKSRTRKNGEPISMAVADTIKKIKEIENESQSTSTANVREDAIAQIFGQDKPGRLRAMGRGVTLTKLNLSRTKGKKATRFESRMLELEKMVHMLTQNQGIESWREESTSQMSNYDKIYDKCDLLDWSGTDEVVAEGRVVSSDPNELVHKIPLGPNAMKILVDFPRKSDAFLWRPTPNLTYIGEAEDEIVAWPASRIVLRMIEHYKKEDNASKINNTYNKCKLYDWSGSEELVAEGRLYSSDPEQLINDIPLGPFAMVVWIDDPKKQDAFLWRPTSDMTYVGEAVGSKVAWPESKVVVEKVNGATSPTPMVSVAASSPMVIKQLWCNK